MGGCTRVQALGGITLWIKAIHQESQQLACQGNVVQFPTSYPSLTLTSLLPLHLQGPRPHFLLLARPHPTPCLGRQSPRGSLTHITPPCPFDKTPGLSLLGAPSCLLASRAGVLTVPGPAHPCPRAATLRGSWEEIDGETAETVSDFMFLGSKITADGDCSHEIKDVCSLEGKL